MKPYIKQKPFSRRSGHLSLGSLDRVSTFETLRAYGGKMFLWEKHAARLADSCRGLGEGLPDSIQNLRVWVEAGLKESGYSDALLRLSIHGSNRAVLIVRPFHAHPAEWYKKGVSLVTAVARRSELKAQDPQIKASQFVTGVLAHLDKKGAPHELLLLGPVGTVAEGTVSNLFFVKEKTLLTPAAGSGILRGVTRDFVMGLARAAGIDVRETFLTRHEWYSADECFMTNTSSEVLPIVSVDRRKIGDGIPGPVTRQLASAFKKYVQSLS